MNQTDGACQVCGEPTTYDGQLPILCPKHKDAKVQPRKPYITLGGHNKRMGR